MTTSPLLRYGSVITKFCLRLKYFILFTPNADANSIVQGKIKLSLNLILRVFLLLQCQCKCGNRALKKGKNRWLRALIILPLKSNFVRILLFPMSEYFWFPLSTRH